MEFAEYILTSKVNKVAITIPPNTELEAVICITGHHLIISSRKDGAEEIWVSLITTYFVS